MSRIIARPSQSRIGGDEILEEIACAAGESDDACLRRAKTEVARHRSAADLEARIIGDEVGVTAWVAVDDRPTRIDVASWDHLAQELEQLKAAGKSVVLLSGQVALDPATRKALVSGNVGGHLVRTAIRFARFQWPQPRDGRAATLSRAQQRAAERSLSITSWEFAPDGLASLDVLCPPPE